MRYPTEGPMYMVKRITLTVYLRWNNVLKSQLARRKFFMRNINVGDLPMEEEIYLLYFGWRNVVSYVETAQIILRLIVARRRLVKCKIYVEPTSVVDGLRGFCSFNDQRIHRVLVVSWDLACAVGRQSKFPFI